MRLLLVLSLLFSSASFALTVKTKALTRNKKFKAKVKDVELKDLVSKTHFDGKYFKIVLGKSEEPIEIGKDKNLSLKAATSYYHLTKARDYFKNVIKAQNIETMPKIVVRLEMTALFNPRAHYQNENKEPEYNNALTIPGGKGIVIPGTINVGPWDREIWFRPKKQIVIDKKGTDYQIKEIFKVLDKYKDRNYEVTFQQILISLANDTVFVGSEDAINARLEQSVITTLFVDALFRVVKPNAYLLIDRRYYIDAAMVPEIIYSEYAHAALLDSFSLYDSTPINEGMADYFAAMIANNDKLASKLKSYYRARPKDGDSEQCYSIDYESNELADTGFVFSLLWQARDILGKDQAASIIYDLRKVLNSSSYIRTDLVTELLKSCRKRCKNSRADVIRLYQFFSSRCL